MNGLFEFLKTSYTAYQAVQNAQTYLTQRGFCRLFEGEPWNIAEGGKYFVIRGGSSLIAFTVNKGISFKIVASHTDSPCLKLKENPVIAAEGVYKLNAEPYGGGIYYSFFDRPLKIAGRTVTEKKGALTAASYISDFQVTIPSLAVHMNRETNEKFAPNPQIDLLPLLAASEINFAELIGNPLSYDLFLACAEEPFTSGANGEFLTAPRVDNLTSVYASLTALGKEGAGVCVAACLDHEEVGSQTAQGAGGDFLSVTLTRIASARGLSQEEYFRALSSSFLVSLDNAHALHPNRPEKCDPTNRAKMGGGIVIKSHANKAYTTEAMSSALVKTIFEKANVSYQTFYNRSDMRSGSTLGAISQGQVSMLSVDLGIAQLAMHAMMETFCKQDYAALIEGLTAIYRSEICIQGETLTVK